MEGVDMFSITWRRAGALLPFLVLAACGGGGGGGGGGTATFTVTALNPAVSVDLTGGDLITITGTNFQTAAVDVITFGGIPGTNRTLVSETELTVVTPPAPGGSPGAVDVVFTSLSGGTLQVPDAYTYASSAPNPQTIAPTSFTATGAESFTITGTTLGPLGGQVTVIFQGIGSVTATVSANGTSVTGRAPLAGGVPPIGGITVTLDTGSATVDVPTPVSYVYAPPIAVGVAGVPSQTAGNASQPVRISDGYAVLCTAGVDGGWGTSDDEIRIVTGPPAATAVASVAPRGFPGTQVGYLSATSSIPVILGPDTFAVYSSGAPGPGPGFILVTAARTAPVADIFSYPGINAAPVAAIGPARIAFAAAGPDTVFGPPPGNLSDDLVIADFNLALSPPPVLVTRVAAGFADTAITGPGNFSIPFSADGDTVFMMGIGPDAIRWTGDDTIIARVMSTATTSTLFSAPFLLGRPIAFSSSLLAVPGVGPNGLVGGGDDTLEVFSYTGPWARTPHLLGATFDAAALVPYARVGNGIAVPVAGGIRVYTNLLAGTASTLPFFGSALFAPLGNGGLVAFGPGPNLVPGTGTDDVAMHIDSAGTTVVSFSLIPNLFQAVVALSDADRVFAVSPGPDGAFQSPDDTLEVYQTRSLGQSRSVTPLPVSALPVARVMGTLPFVPVGPGWGLLQSPGTDVIFGNADDQLILVTY